MPNYINAISVKFANNTFKGKTVLNSVNLGNTEFVNNSMYQAFDRCNNLTTVTNIPENITQMSYAFANSKLAVTPTIPNTITPNGLIGTFQNSNITEPPIIPNNVRNLYDTFELCHNLINTPVIPNSVTNMGYTFYNCNNLTVTPTIPNAVTTIQFAFCGCVNLTTPPVVPNSVMNASGFIAYCPQFLNNYPTIPSSVTVFDWAFCGMGGNLTDVPQLCFDIYANLSSTAKKSMRYWFSHWDNLVNTPAIPNGVTDLECCYSDDKNLVNATGVIPDSVTTMTRTFRECNSLVNVSSLPNSITRLYYTFENCRSLVNGPTIPDSVTNAIGVFYNCKSLISGPSIGNSVVDADSMFSQCSNLVTAPDIPASVVNIRGTFDSCTNLTGNVYIYSNNISFATNCFGYTTLVKNVYIPFTNSDNSVSKTYNSFITAGYDELGTKHGVYLKNLYCTLTISPTPNDAIVILTADGYTQSGNSITVKAGTQITYSVSKTGYQSISNQVTLYDDDTIACTLVKENYTLTVNVTPADATITFSTGTVSGNTCTVPYGTTVTYDITRTGYQSLLNQSTTVTSNLTVTKTLTPDAYTLTINPSPSDATVTLIAAGYTQSGNSISVPGNTTVNWSVTKTGCTSYSSSTVVTQTETLSNPTLVTIDYGSVTDSVVGTGSRDAGAVTDSNITFTFDAGTI